MKTGVLKEIKFQSMERVGKNTVKLDVGPLLPWLLAGARMTVGVKRAA